MIVCESNDLVLVNRSIRLTEVQSQGYTARRYIVPRLNQRIIIVANHPLAGQPAPASMLVNIPRLIMAYYTENPDMNLSEQRVVLRISRLIFKEKL